MRFSIRQVADSVIYWVRSSIRLLSFDGRRYREQVYVEKPLRQAIQAITIGNSATKTLVRANPANANQVELVANWLVISPGTSSTLALPAEDLIAGVPLFVVNASSSNALNVDDTPGGSGDPTVVAAGQCVCFLTAGSGGIVAMPFVAPS